MTNPLAQGVVGRKLIDWFEQFEMVPVRADSVGSVFLPPEEREYEIEFEDGETGVYRVLFTSDYSLTILEAEHIR